MRQKRLKTPALKRHELRNDVTICLPQLDGAIPFSVFHNGTTSELAGLLPEVGSN